MSANVKNGGSAASMELPTTSNDLGTFATMVWTWSVEFLPRLGSAILILVLGYIAATWASRGVYALAQRSKWLDRTLPPVFAGVARYGILIIVFIAALGQLGIQTTSLLAVLGAAGLAIGLALQGTLSNIAAGIMILWLRPFSAGDFIETDAVAGTVEEIGLFHAQIRTWDGIYKFVPNAQLWNVILTNYTRNPTRMILLEFGISYDDDIAQGRRILKETAKKHSGVLADPPPVVVPLQLGDNAVVLQLRAWAPNAEFWNIRWDLTQDGKKNLEAAGFTIPFPQRVVHMSADSGNGAALPTSSRKPRAKRAVRASRRRVEDEGAAFEED
jgi:small conductance mechanosensitive channel